MAVLNPYIWNMAFEAYLDARKNKRNTVDAHRFEANANLYLADLVRDIDNRTYAPSRGIAFIVSRPVVREIFAAPFRDRVVHHMIYNTVAPWWDRHFIDDNYSCRVGKGTLYGINRMRHHIASVSENYTKETYILKLDLSGYFMSLPRARLFDTVMWGLDRQFHRDSVDYGLVRFLVRQIIYDDPTRGVRLKGGVRDWDKLPKNKSLFNARKGCGIVIGNLTSQLFSNVYLNQLDRFVTMELGHKHYGRYVDDFYVVSNSRVELIELIQVIEEYLDGIELVLHPKKRIIRDVRQGIDFLGVTIYPHRTIPNVRMKKGLYDAAYYEDAERVQTYLGLMSHYNHKKWGMEAGVTSSALRG